MKKRTYLIILLLLISQTLIVSSIRYMYYKKAEIKSLASIINAECGICEESEKYKVGSVVLNRVASTEFPNTIELVIKQDNQFHGYGTKQYLPDKASLSIAKRLIDGIGRVPEILYFWGDSSTNSNFVDKMKSRIMYTEKYHHYAK